MMRFMPIRPSFVLCLALCVAACDASAVQEEVQGQAAVEPTAPLPEPTPEELPPGVTVEVMHITDGDTIVVMHEGSPERVRLIGIDTPEAAGSPRGAQPYNEEATSALRSLLRESQVTLRGDAAERDDFNRLLAYVYSADGTFVNAEMVRRGWARPMTVPPNVRHADRFVELASEARAAGLGIWQNEP